MARAAGAGQGRGLGQTPPAPAGGESQAMQDQPQEPGADNPISGLDHALVLVEDLDRARDRFAALGFTLSPRGLHSTQRGTANHTIMLEGAYIELLGVLTPTPLNAERRASLAAAGPGLHGLAFRIEDAGSAPAALAGRGLRTHSASDFSRPVPLAGGGEALASFRTHQMDRAQFPLGMAFLCQHLTPDLLWQPALLDHPNTATRIAEVIGVSPDPARDGAEFARLLGWRDAGAGLVRPQGPGTALRLMRRADYEALLSPAIFGRAPEGIHAALRVQVRDLATARLAITAAGGAFREIAAGIAIPAEKAAGVALILSAEG